MTKQIKVYDEEGTPTSWWDRLWGRLFKNKIITRRKNEEEEEAKRRSQLSIERNRLLVESQNKLDILQKYAKKFKLEVLQDIYNQSKVVHDCIRDNNIKIQRLEQFHLYYTDHFLALFTKIDKEFEEKNVLLQKRLVLIEDKIKAIQKDKQKLEDKIKALQVLRSEKKDYEDYIRLSINKLFDQFTADQSRERQKVQFSAPLKPLIFNFEEDYLKWVIQPDNLKYVRSLDSKYFKMKELSWQGTVPIPIKFPCYIVDPNQLKDYHVECEQVQITGSTYLNPDGSYANKYLFPKTDSMPLIHPPKEQWFDKYHKIGKYYFQKELSKILYEPGVMATLKYVNSLGGDQIFRVYYKEQPFLFLLQRQKFILELYTSPITERDFDEEIKTLEMVMTPINFDLDKAQLEKDGLEQEKFNLSLDPDTTSLLEQYLTKVKDHKGEIDPQNIDVEKENLKKMLTLNVTNI